MPWWKSSSSLPSSPASSPSPKFAASPNGGRSGKTILFWRWRDAGQKRRLTRQHRLRYVTDDELGDLGVDSRSSASTPGAKSSVLDSGDVPLRSASAPAPQALPLPSLKPWNGSHPPEMGGLGSAYLSGQRLPSPREASGRAEASEVVNGVSHETNVERGFSVSPVGNRLATLTNQPAQKTPERNGIPSRNSSIVHRRKVLQDDTTNYLLNIPAKSAPASGFSSPVRSPNPSPKRRFHTATPSGLQVNLGSEMHLSDFGPAFSPKASPEKVFNSSDHSPLHSPTIRSPMSRSRNPSAPSSPLHPKILCDARHENGNKITVHPLPLPPPPGAPVASQSNFIHSSQKAEVLTMTNQWQKQTLIGSGTFGQVYVASNRNTGALCAMKEVNIIPDDVKSVESIKQLEQEIKFLSQFKHPNIVQYYGSETIGDQFYIYLEYVHPGSINKYVRQYYGAMTESVVRNFTRHILKGLAYLHSKQIVHRDIKGANLLVDSNGVVKLADFGMAKHLSGAASALSLKGSPYWMAPEVVQATLNKDVGYDLSVDIWSLGCTIIEMFTGKHPWSGLEGAAAMFKALHREPPIPETLSDEGKDFLQCCFRRNPADRPTAIKLLEHNFIRNSDHHNHHGSLQSFSGMKSIDSSLSPRDSKSRSESYSRGRHLHNNHPETPESAAVRSSIMHHCSFPDNVLSLSPQSNHIMSGPSVPSSNTMNGNFQPYALPKPQ